MSTCDENRTPLSRLAYVLRVAQSLHMPEAARQKCPPRSSHALLSCHLCRIGDEHTQLVFVPTASGAYSASRSVVEQAFS